MKRKLIAVAVVFVISMVIFTGCGGGSNQGGGSTGNNTPTVAQLTVIIKDDAGKTLPDATVKISPGMEKITDSSGKAIFDSLKPGDYEIKIEKDGYNAATDTVTLKEGDKRTINVTLEKAEEQAEAAKNFSDLKSYKAVMEFSSDSNSNDNGKIVLIQDDYGKEQHIIMYDKDGKIQFELYAVGNKAKVKSGDGKWTEIPSSAASGITGSTLGFAEGMMNNTLNYFNKAVVGKYAEYSVKRVGSEEVNGYPTYKYHLIAKSTAEGNKSSLVGDIWIINKGPYKDYITRMVLEFEDVNGSKGTFTVNLVDIGKDMHIVLP